jgi:hypothetical protein
MVDLTRCLPNKVFCCLEFESGSKILLALIILTRFISMVLGCLYGPYLYLVLPLGGLYLAADFLLLYTIFGISGLSLFNNNENHQQRHLAAQVAAQSETASENTCDYHSQKIWIFVWLILNVLAIIGLFVVIGLFADLGWWSMTYEPIHIAVFFMILILLGLIIYGHIIVITLYLILKYAWISGLLNGSDDEDMAGLTRGGKRICA